MSSPQTGDSNPQLKHVFFHGAWKPKFQPQNLGRTMCYPPWRFKRIVGRLLLIGAEPKGWFCYSSWWFQHVSTHWSYLHFQDLQNLHVSSFNYLVLDIYIYIRPPTSPILKIRTIKPQQTQCLPTKINKLKGTHCKIRRLCSNFTMAKANHHQAATVTTATHTARNPCTFADLTVRYIHLQLFMIFRLFQQEPKTWRRSRGICEVGHLVLRYGFLKMNEWGTPPPEKRGHFKGKFHVNQLLFFRGHVSFQRGS